MNKENLKINLKKNISDEDTRRPGQRPATAMLGNEIMTKEQLYDLFQQILAVKKFEHQLLYNAMQVRMSVNENKFEHQLLHRKRQVLMSSLVVLIVFK
jgi:hypothetical protein